MTGLHVQAAEYMFDNNNQVIGYKPDLILALSEVASVFKPRKGHAQINTKQGRSFIINRPLSMVFGDVIAQKGVSEILNELPVYEEYTYKTVNGQTARSCDKRSAASFVPLGK